MVLSHPSTLLVRWLHLVGVGVALGGSALTWALCRRAVAAADVAAARSALAAAEAYEWLFWAALGAVVAAGVGNLGALGAVPGLETPWGRTLALKLLAVLGFLVGSAVRMLYVTLAAMESSPDSDSAAVRGAEAAYAATTIGLLVLVGFGEVLAHG